MCVVNEKTKWQKIVYIATLSHTIIDYVLVNCRPSYNLSCKAILPNKFIGTILLSRTLPKAKTKENHSRI